VEIVIIGDPNGNNPYAPMRAFDYSPADPSKNPVDFDPTVSGKQGPHVDVMEIIYKEAIPYCTSSSSNSGHTYFDTSYQLPDGTIVAQWFWDTKGYTPTPVGPFGYRRPGIYPTPLHNYFSEGAYGSIAQGAKPGVFNCTFNSCDMVKTTRFSPMNLNDMDYTVAPAFTVDGSGNVVDYGTVEFNNLTFDAGTGAIEPFNAATVRGTGYTTDEVLRRTIVHEMGHALGFEHCPNNPSCVMYNWTEDWEPHGFGDVGSCQHSLNGTEDIRTKGGFYTNSSGQSVKIGIWNTRHY
jgi:hypothetical protein